MVDVIDVDDLHCHLHARVRVVTDKHLHTQREGEREGGREGEREGGREREREGGRERGREGERETVVHAKTIKAVQYMNSRLN